MMRTNAVVKTVCSLQTTKSSVSDLVGTDGWNRCAFIQQGADGGAALLDTSQSPQQFVIIDGPANTDALGWEQAVIVGIPHPFVPILPVPIDRHPHPGPLRNFIRVLFQIAHDAAPANALIAR
jgi:hypothetical protein